MQGASFSKVLQQLSKEIREPLGALVVVFALMFSGLAFRYDLTNPASHAVMYFFMLFSTLCFIILVVYKRLTLGTNHAQIDVAEVRPAEAKKDSRIKHLENEVEILRDRLLMSAKVRNWQVYEDRIDIRSIDTDLDTPESYKDKEHHYTELVFNASVDYAGNYAGRYIRRGYRKVPGVTDFLYFRVGASSQQETDANLSLVVADLDSKKNLAVDLVDNSDLISKVFRIHLGKSLNQGDQFNIQISFKWPNCIVNSRDTDTIDISSFTLGVDRLRYEIHFPFDVSSVRLFETKGSDIVRSTAQLIQKENKKKPSISYAIDNPKSTGYVIAFTRPISDAAE